MLNENVKFEPAYNYQLTPLVKLKIYYFSRARESGS